MLSCHFYFCPLFWAGRGHKPEQTVQGEVGPARQGLAPDRCKPGCTDFGTRVMGMCKPWEMDISAEGHLSRRTPLPVWPGPPPVPRACPTPSPQSCPPQTLWFLAMRKRGTLLGVWCFWLQVYLSKPPLLSPSEWPALAVCLCEGLWCQARDGCMLWCTGFYGFGVVSWRE